MADYQTKVVFQQIGPEDKTVEFGIEQGAGDIYILVNGQQQGHIGEDEGAHDTMTVTVKEGDTIDFNVDGATGWEFDYFTGDEPPYTIEDTPPLMG